jgi:4-hydroxy-3-polyprenylbenzoate decarboxylase
LKAGELKRVVVPVDTDLLIAEWADCEMKSPGGGKALLFRAGDCRWKKSEFPVAINTMGSRRRMAVALQVADIEDVAREIQLILKAKPPTDLREGWNLLKQEFISYMRAQNPCAMRHVGSCASQKWRELFPQDLPILKCWPKDGGRFITLANVHARTRDRGPQRRPLPDASLR